MASKLAVVAIGASSGGLEAVTRLLEAWAVETATAFILVQHLDPSGESLLPALLEPHTALIVSQAAEGMPVAPGHLYVIPPGAHLSVADTVLHLSTPPGAYGHPSALRFPAAFLAAASHDLRQPLQTLALLQALLTDAVTGEKAKNLVARQNTTLGTVTGMLDTLLDINEIEAGAVQPDISIFAIGDLLERLSGEFTYHAEAKGIQLRIVSCRQQVRSDLKLLEQMIRNLLSNAIKYTAKGRVLLGCRIHGGVLTVEVWDTGSRSRIHPSDRPLPSVAGCRCNGTALPAKRRSISAIRSTLRSRLMT